MFYSEYRFDRIPSEIVGVIFSYLNSKELFKVMILINSYVKSIIESNWFLENYFKNNYAYNTWQSCIGISKNSPETWKIIYKSDMHKYKTSNRNNIIYAFDQLDKLCMIRKLYSIFNYPVYKCFTKSQIIKHLIEIIYFDSTHIYIDERLKSLSLCKVKINFNEIELVNKNTHLSVNDSFIELIKHKCDIIDTIIDVY